MKIYVLVHTVNDIDVIMNAYTTYELAKQAYDARAVGTYKIVATTLRENLMPYFDRIDVCEAYYLYASLYHGGMGTKEYRMLSRLRAIKFRPAPSLSVETLNENAREIFDNLVIKRQK